MHPALPEDRFDGQPLANERLLLVADIRIDNAVELRRALGGEFDGRKKSDADLLFAAWLRWGEQCLDRIVGDYALAAFDRASDSLILARDPAGQRPLFYARSADSVRFASMPSGLFAGRRPDLNFQRLAQMLALAEPLDPSTAFAGMKRIIPGQLVRFIGGRLQSQRRWKPAMDEVGRSPEELVEAYRAHLDEAVAQRVRRISGPLAAHLSSGWDSSSVTATAARLLGPEQMLAFTSAPAQNLRSAAPRGRPTDEADVAAETARALGIEHHIVRDSDPLLARVAAHARACQEPPRNLFNIGWWRSIQEQAHERGARVLLTAERGNMTLNAGTLTVLSEWPRKREWRSWWREASAVVDRRGVSWRGVLYVTFQPWLPRPLISVLDRARLGTDPGALDRFIRPHLRPRRALAPSFQSRKDERVAIYSRADPGVLRKGSLGATGIEERDPMADRRLLEFSLSLPPEHLLHDGILRPLARQALADRVPKSVIDLPARGYQGGDWASRLNRADVGAILEEVSASPGAQELLDMDRLRRVVADWPELDAGSMAGFTFGRDFTRALATGMFIREVEQNFDRFGV